MGLRALKLFKWRLPQSTVTIFAQSQLPLHGGKLYPCAGNSCLFLFLMQQESCWQHSRNNELSYSSGWEKDRSFWGQKGGRFPQKPAQALPLILQQMEKINESKLKDWNWLRKVLQMLTPPDTVWLRLPCKACFISPDFLVVWDQGLGKWSQTAVLHICTITSRLMDPKSLHTFHTEIMSTITARFLKAKFTHINTFSDPVDL